MRIHTTIIFDIWKQFKDNKMVESVESHDRLQQERDMAFEKNIDESKPIQFQKFASYHLFVDMNKTIFGKASISIPTRCDLRLFSANNSHLLSWPLAWQISTQLSMDSNKRTPKLRTTWATSPLTKESAFPFPLQEASPLWQEDIMSGLELLFQICIIFFCTYIACSVIHLPRIRNCYKIWILMAINGIKWTIRKCKRWY